MSPTTGHQPPTAPPVRSSTSSRGRQYQVQTESFVPRNARLGPDCNASAAKVTQLDCIRWWIATSWVVDPSAWTCSALAWEPAVLATMTESSPRQARLQ